MHHHIVAGEPASDAASSADRRVTPGPRGVLASALNFMRMQRDALAFLRRLDRGHPCDDLAPVRFVIAGQVLYLLRHPRHVHRLFRDPDGFPRTQTFTRQFRATLGYSLVTVSDVDEWKAARRRTTRHFKGPALQRHGAGVNEVLRDHALPVLARKAARGEAVDVFGEMLDIASLAVFVNFCGDRRDEVPADVYRRLNRILCYLRRRTLSMAHRAIPPWLPTAANRQVHADIERVHAYLAPRLARADGETMLGDVVRAHTDASGRLDTLRVLQEMTSNLIGGSETTIILMAWALYFVMQHPAVEEALVAEIVDVVGDLVPTTEHLRDMPYLDAVVEETLRMRPPAYMTGRRVAQDTDLDGHRLSGGAIALVCQWISHHEPRLWPAPHRFRPERFLKDHSGSEARPARPDETAYFPFGGGQYFCIGAQYAINEAKLMLATLLRAFRFTPADPLAFRGVGVDASLTLRPDRPILVRVAPRA